MKTFRLPLFVGLFCALNFGNVFAAPTITAMQDDGTPAATRKLVGDTVTYTTTISNTAAVIVGSTANDASGVQLTNPTPTNTTEVAGATISPIAFDDVYPQTILPNIGINSANIPYNVFGNDYLGTPPVTTIASFDSTSAHGGTVSMTTSGASIGQFTYSPPPGYTGTDTFTYTLTNSVGSSVGTVTITIATSPVIWFVNPAVASTGNGTLSSPFKTVAEAVTAIGTNTDHRIFLYSGAQTTGITLKANSWLVGQAATGTSFDSLMGISPASGTIARPTLNSTKPTLSNASGSVVTLADNNTILGVAITGGATGAAVASSGTVNTGLIGNATTSDVTISGAGGGAFSLGAGNGNFGVNTPITSVTGRSIAVTSRTGGTVSFTGAISDTGTGISLTTNTGTTLNFTAGLSLSTGPNSAFAATGGGTVNATQNNTTIVNTLTTTTGTALNVTGTTIGASGLTFRSISASGASKGVVLNSTGSGAFSVLGIGTTAGSGGTIQNATNNGVELKSATNITLNNMNLAGNGTAQTVSGANTNCGGNLVTSNNLQCVANLYMSGVTGVTLTGMSITNSGQQGINGNAVSGLSIIKSTITGNGNEAQEDGILIQDLTGTNLIQDTTIKDNFQHQVYVENGSGISTLSVNKNTGSTVIGNSNNPASGGDHAFQFNLHGTANGTLQIDTITVQNNGQGNGIQSNVQGTSSLNGFAQNSAFNNDAAAFNIQNNNSATINFNILNNTQMTGNRSQAINIGTASGSTGSVTSKISGNHIGTQGVLGSACDVPGGNAACSGITFGRFGTNAISMTISNNLIYQVGNNGIQLNTDFTGSVAFKITGNTVSEPYPPSGAGVGGPAMYLNFGTSASASGQAVCLDLTGNTIGESSNYPPYGWDPNNTAKDIQVRARNGAVVSIANYGGGNSAANVVSYVNTHNTLVQGTQADILVGGSFANGAASCGTPLLLAEGGVTTIRNAPSSLSYSATSLNQHQLDSITSAAMQRWLAAGLTAQQIVTLSSLKFEVADLPGLRLGEADGNHIRVDNNAGGNGWFIGSAQDDKQFGKVVSATRSYTDSTSAPAGRIDLLTAIMHEMGHALGLDDTYAEQDRDSLMYGYLMSGERRLPTKNQAAGVVPHEHSGPHFLTGTVTVPTLPPNKSVKIVYSVTVGPISGNPQQISSQATVSGSNFSSVLATDAVAGSGPTITLLGIPPSFTSATSTTFTAGTFGSFNVTANGAPTPTITFTGSLPSGVMFGMGSLAGTATAFGTFPLVFTASNGVGSNAMQNFSLVVNPSAQDVKSKPSITPNGVGVFHVAFIGNPGTQYTIQFAPTLPVLPAVPNWQTLSVQTANASGIFSVDDNPAGTTVRFYRAIIP